MSQHHDDFEIEPVEGLPETPPEGERILWQGRPDWWALSVESLSLKWVAGYFVLLMMWRFVSVMDLLPLGHAIGATVPFALPLGCRRAPPCTPLPTPALSCASAPP